MSDEPVENWQFWASRYEVEVAVCERYPHLTKTNAILAHATASIAVARAAIRHEMGRLQDAAEEENDA